MPPFGGGVRKARRRRWRGRLRLFRWNGSQFRDGFDDAFAMPEWDAELLQVRVGQVGQDVRVDRVLAEKGEVLAKPQTLQPVAHIHGRASHGLVRQWFSCGKVSSGAVGAPANEEIKVASVDRTRSEGP
jgi:hypothetical protein